MRRRCSCCGRMRPIEDIHSITRHGGGNYRRAGWMIPTSICSECAVRLAPRASVGSGRLTTERYNSHTLIRIARELYTPRSQP